MVNGERLAGRLVHPSVFWDCDHRLRPQRVPQPRRTAPRMAPPMEMAALTVAAGAFARADIGSPCGLDREMVGRGCDSRHLSPGDVAGLPGLFNEGLQ